MPVPDMSYFEKIVLKLKLVSGNLGLKPVYIGSFGGEALNNQFSCTEYLENFGFGETRLKESNFNCVIIFGNLNFIQLDLLKHLRDQAKHRIESIIYIQGPLTESLIHKSYFIPNDIEEVIKPNVTYKKFPINFNELYSLIKENQEESLHG